MVSLCLIVAVVLWSVTAAQQYPIPSTPLGFVYNSANHSAPVHIEIFLDLECPDSKAAWPIIKSVADSYGPAKVRVKAVIFPLPYHRNAYVAAEVSGRRMEIFLFKPLSIYSWTSAFLLDVHRLCGTIEGRLSHFLPRWLRTGWQSVISQGKIP